ncbi:hypothetical protein RB195_010260 [Necator americanus]|uniref:Uncharacterized protein n=1 Tax=Necator americanus TaxID=51031 RepID=A0ABR1CXX2_NECAM
MKMCILLQLQEFETLKTKRCRASKQTRKEEIIWPLYYLQGHCESDAVQDLACFVCVVNFDFQMFLSEQQQNLHRVHNPSSSDTQPKQSYKL